MTFEAASTCASAQAATLETAEAAVAKSTAFLSEGEQCLTVEAPDTVRSVLEAVATAT